MAWWDLYKLFTYSFEPDPLSKRAQTQPPTGAGVTQPDAIPDIRQDGSYWGGGKGLIRLRDTNDFVDLSTVSNRQSRYKEYERLRNVAEIESAMTVFADEACLIGSTPVSTLMWGDKSIKWLAENKANEDFLVYCYDFYEKDFTLGWAFDPRLVKTAPTVRVILDDGTDFTATEDHRVLLKNGEWVMAGDLARGSLLMPFYRISPDPDLTKIKHHQFPRIYSKKRGWIHERQFIDEWKLGKEIKDYEKVNQACRCLTGGLNTRETAKLMKHQWPSINKWLQNEGFSTTELKWLGDKSQERRVINVLPSEEQEVYDLSVRDHRNFCGKSVVFHNCQKGDDNHIFHVECENEQVKKEVEWLFYNKKMLNTDSTTVTWSRFKNLVIYGDLFLEALINPDSPKDGILKLVSLPPDSMYRIETTKGKLIEFQQAAEGPDFEAITKSPVTTATEAELQQSKALRFAPNQIVHIKIGDDRKTFYPYGQSLIEPARGPAHQLRLMEDAMLVYRLVRAPERRVFYIDVGQLPPFKAEAFIDRMKDQLRKKKVASQKSPTPGANTVEERWHPAPADEDFWVPIRPNANTRIETLPGAQNLGEIDDAVYFRNKLFTAMNFPKNYFNNEDPGVTRITLSAQDVKFARLIERLQSHVEDGFQEIAERHLVLRGFPEESYESLKITMTPPSDWREMSRAEVTTNRIQNASTLKGSVLYSDYDVLTRVMKFSEEEAQDIIARTDIQKLKDVKLQIIAQNPQLLGVGVPSPDETEIGAEPGGPSPMLGPGGAAPPGGDMMGGAAPPGGGGDMGGDMMGGAGGDMMAATPPETTQATMPLPDPTKDDLKKFDLEIQSYSKEQDHEEIDYSVEG